MDKFDTKTRSRIMASIRSKNTSPEIKIRKALWKAGFRYRIHYGKEKIDVAFTKPKIALFIDGCFWHSCPLHSHVPKGNREYWEKKLKKNIERAKLKDVRLQSQGWQTIHIWEHELGETDKIVSKLSKIILNSFDDEQVDNITV